MTLIDADSLTAYAEEILRTPEVWQKRDKGRATAMARLRQMLIRVLLAQGLGSKRKVETSFTAIWAAEMEPALACLGKKPERKAESVAALQRFLDHLSSRNLFISLDGISR